MESSSAAGFSGGVRWTTALPATRLRISPEAFFSSSSSATGSWSNTSSCARARAHTRQRRQGGGCVRGSTALWHTAHPAHTHIAHIAHTAWLLSSMAEAVGHGTGKKGRGGTA
eukprot:223858-Rhodomonas_salina.1